MRTIILRWTCGALPVLLILGIAGVSAIAQEPPAPEPAGQPDSSATQTDRVIARVGNYSITASEFQKDVALRWSLQGPGAKATAPDSNFKAQVLRELIDARILRILAKNSGVKVTGDEVLAEYEQGRRKFPSDDAFDQYMAKLHLTSETLMDEIRDRIQVDKYKAMATADITVAEDEVAKVYEKVRAAGQAKRDSETTDLYQILIMPKANTDPEWESAKGRIEAARQRIIDGESFETVAKDVSQDPVSAKDGGHYREATAKKMDPDLAKKMSELPIGELSQPIRSQVGWHLLRVDARHAAGEMSLEDAAPAIREHLLNEKKDRFIASAVDDARSIIRVEVLPGEK